MPAKAIEKLRTEMTGSNNPYVPMVGEFLIKHLQSNPDDSSKILNIDKSIAKSMQAMQAEAKKKQVGGMAVLSDAEGFAIVLKYFGVGEMVEAVPAVDTAGTPTQEDIDAEFEAMML
ncbi:hypothetical protein [Paenibacillus agricola]|uniref:Uncharacterized protein n=1 Tax=Paenibacillus agricola TaxID=2716264 RepID=A0ABX0JDQ0_9BACL|nr:hypothetical protein [Paenibacillus agricola]NHN33520.1 hypothetical protein [Paenibacillus agricola]